MDDKKFVEQLAAIASVAKLPVEEGDKEIFKNYYKARADLVAIQAELLTLAPGDKDFEQKKSLQLGCVHLAMGTNYIETEETSKGQESLATAQKYLHTFRGKGVLKGEESDVKDDEVDTSQDDVLMDIYNNQGLVWSSRNEDDRAETFLKGAEKLYEDYLARNGNGIFDKEKKDRYEDLYTTTVFFLAQVYAQKRNSPTASRYVLLTLQKQLETKREFDKKEWASNALHLASFFLGDDKFPQAEYCIRAAQHVHPAGEDEKLDANIALAWGKYYLNFLRTCQFNKNEGNLQSFDYTEEQADWKFNLPIDPPAKKVDLCQNWDQALTHFKKATPKFEAALKYYKLDCYCTDYIDIQSELGQLWRVMAGFETDLDRKVSMHKKRIALYEPMVNQINVTSYLAYVRKILYELGEIWNEIFDIRQAQMMQGSAKLNLKKVNGPALESAKYLNMFLSTFLKKNQKTDTLEIPLEDTVNEDPDNVDEDYYRTWIIANMHIARGLTRMQAPDFQTACAYIDAAVKRYEFIDKMAEDYGIKENKEIETELKLCAELRVLLPGKKRQLEKQYMG